MFCEPKPRFLESAFDDDCNDMGFTENDRSQYNDSNMVLNADESEENMHSTFCGTPRESHSINPNRIGELTAMHNYHVIPTNQPLDTPIATINETTSNAISFKPDPVDISVTFPNFIPNPVNIPINIPEINPKVVNIPLNVPNIELRQENLEINIPNIAPKKVEL